jgi:EpsG family
MLKERVALYITYLISPFLTLPVVIDLVVRNKKVGYILLSILLGLMVYMYEPGITADLYRYYERFEAISNMTSFSEVLIYTERTSDFGLYFFQYLLGITGGSFQIYLLLVTILNTSLLFYVIRKIIDKIEANKSTRLLLFTFLFATITINWIMGASRFFTAISIMVFSYYIGIVEQKRKGDLIIFLAPFFHFSTIALLAIYFIAKYVKIPASIFRIIFIVSLTFYLIPKDVSQNIVRTVILQKEIVEGVYEDKVEAYTLDKDYKEKGREMLNYAGLVVQFIIGKVPFILIVLFTLFAGFKFDKFYYLVFTLVNVTSAFETVSGRFAYLLAILFALSMISYIYEKRKLNSFVIVFFSLRIIASLILAMQLSSQIASIFFNKRIVTLITILSKQISFSTLNG